jgi:membrane protease YdiL (CAAX protease family)
VNEKPEKLSWLALLPIFATLVFYGLPGSAQQYGLVQFFPQILAYLGIGVWAWHNTHFFHRFGLTTNRLWCGIGWGCLTGLILGICNTMVILWVVPTLGGDISFLKETPHAQVPTLIMVPWGILFIAVVVELNFRGFLLGRLASLLASSLDSQNRRPHNPEQLRVSAGLAAAIGTSSLVFAFDPFMVVTFRHLHWIAVWDGLIWGWMRIRLRNLYAVITAHALEVVIMYLCVKAALT